MLTSSSVLWVFLFVYSISMTTYCFMMSSFFSKASMASIATMVGWFALLLPYYFVKKQTSGSLIKYISCILSNTALMHGVEIINLFEREKENALQWSNIWENMDGNFSLGIIILFLLVSSFFYLLVALYVEEFWPGKIGTPKKWYTLELLRISK